MGAQVLPELMPISTSLENDTMHGRSPEWRIRLAHIHTIMQVAAVRCGSTEASYGNGTTTGYKYGWITSRFCRFICRLEMGYQQYDWDITSEPTAEGDEAYVKES